MNILCIKHRPSGYWLTRSRETLKHFQVLTSCQELLPSRKVLHWRMGVKWPSLKISFVTKSWHQQYGFHFVLFAHQFAHIWPPILEWIKQICQGSLPISIKKIFCILSLFMRQFKECPCVCMLGGKLFEMQCIYWWLNLISNWHTITSWNRSSFAHGRCGSNFRNIILRLIIQNSSLGTQCEIAFMWMTSPLKNQNLFRLWPGTVRQQTIT